MERRTSLFWCVNNKWFIIGAPLRRCGRDVRQWKPCSTTIAFAYFGYFALVVLVADELYDSRKIYVECVPACKCDLIGDWTRRNNFANIENWMKFFCFAFRFFLLIAHWNVWNAIAAVLIRVGNYEVKAIELRCSYCSFVYLARTRTLHLTVEIIWFRLAHAAHEPTDVLFCHPKRYQATKLD